MIAFDSRFIGVFIFTRCGLDIDDRYFGFIRDFIKTMHNVGKILEKLSCGEKQF
jgi:hypothetical protein